MLSRCLANFQYRAPQCGQHRSRLPAIRTVAGLFFLLVAMAENAPAAVTATGNISPDPPEEHLDLHIGTGGYGTFRIDDGSTFNSSSVYLGESVTGFGRATVTGAGSTWTMAQMILGNGGAGQLEVSDGGVAIVNNNFEMPQSSQGQATVTVTGPGSLLQANSNMYVGRFGAATLKIANEGLINLPGRRLEVDSRGQIQFDGGLVRASSFANGGIISGSGSIELSICCGGGESENDGRIRIAPGDHLRFSGPDLANVGEFFIDGGELELNGRLRNDRQGQRSGFIELSQGTLRTGFLSEFSSEKELINEGLLAAVGGENHVYGTVDNSYFGQIAITNNSLLMFHDDVVARDNSLMTVSAGSSAIFLQDLDLNEGTLLADLTGATGFGHVEVIGDFLFFGSLAVNLAEGYEPQAGDSFSLVQTAGTFTGVPDTSALPALAAGLDWQLAASDHELVLSVVALPEIAGDFDHDGDVDGSDLLAWQRGSSPNPLSSDDLVLWRDNYGTNSAAISNSTSVPEPAGFALLLTIAWGWTAIPKRCQRETPRIC